MSRNENIETYSRIHDYEPPKLSRVSLAKSRQIHVGIIGAGFSGLRCADVLLHHGFKVTILEARDRLGGRVAQSDHLGHLVDLGPNWIHGTKCNPIMTLAEETGTALQFGDEEESVYDHTGHLLHTDEAYELNRLLWDEGLIDQAFRYSKEHHDSIDARTSLQEFVAEKVAEMFTTHTPELSKVKRDLLIQFASMWGCYIGSPISRQSLKFFWLEECIEGENPFVASTYKSILEKVAHPARTKAEILLNCEVTGIQASNSTTNPTAITTNGVPLSFDELVVTTPLGWLKRNKSCFQPALPSRLSEAIDHISYGQLDKVYVSFPAPFWKPSDSEHGSVTDSTSQTATKTSVTESSKQSGRLRFVHWLSPQYTSSNPERWGQEGMDLAALSVDCAHPTLLFYIQGPQSKYIADLVTSAKTQSKAKTQLIEWFRPYYSLLPNYREGDPVCTPKAILATAWAADKFAGYGSYSNFQVGLEKGDEDIEVMRYGIPERSIWFAGEHTAPFVASGTTTGAYLSGETVGNRIANAYGLVKPE